MQRFWGLRMVSKATEGCLMTFPLDGFNIMELQHLELDPENSDFFWNGSRVNGRRHLEWFGQGQLGPMDLENKDFGQNG